MKLKTMQGDELKSEPTDRPVRVMEPDGKTQRTEPCVFRKKGLAIWSCPVQDFEEAMAAGWPTNVILNVTHEASGTCVCSYPSKLEAVGALLAALTLADWTKDTAGVAEEIKADPSKVQALFALRKGRLEIVHIDAHRNDIRDARATQKPAEA